MVTALFVILGVIILISLYDYLSSNSWQAVTAGDRVETVFENRNKSYGAYKIRRNYNLLVILITFSIGGAIAASYGISRVFIKPVVHEKKKETTVDMSTFAEDEKKEEEKELEPLEEKVPEEQKTLAFVPPVIVDKESNDEPTLQDEAKNANIDKETHEGNDLAEEKEPEHKEPEPPKPPEIFEVVGEPAEFPGGRAAMIAFLEKNIKIPPVAEEIGVNGKVYLKFVVSETGNISNVKVQRGIADCKECDEEAKRVVEKMPNWTPGKNNGTPVNQWFTLPIVFKVQ